MRTTIALLFALTLAAGCNNTPGKGTPDMVPSCYMNPQTSYEIINACTTAQPFDRNPAYPKLAPNGVLPPLPPDGGAP